MGSRFLVMLVAAVTVAVAGCADGAQLDSAPAEGTGTTASPVTTEPAASGVATEDAAHEETSDDAAAGEDDDDRGQLSDELAIVQPGAGTDVGEAGTGSGDDTGADPEAARGGVVAGGIREPATAAPILFPAEPGDDGDEVLALQEHLAEMGFAPGTPDGDYGRRTERSVEAFQTVVGLRPTGVADARTVTALATYDYDGLRLVAGDEGPAVERLQRRLAGGPFDPGPADGQYGRKTVEAVWALEKLAGVPVDGDWGPLDEYAWEQLLDGEIGRPERDNELRWVEVDLSQQLVKVYDPGETTPTLVSHASSGSGIPWQNEEHSGSSITPVGDFHINRRISGWRESSLDIGRLYNPLYFNGGIAFHGSLSVPLHPASHGCIRLPMHIAEYLPAELPNGTPVHVMA